MEIHSSHEPSTAQRKDGNIPFRLVLLKHLALGVIANHTGVDKPAEV